MKFIYTIVFLFIVGNSFAQSWPIQQNLGSSSTIVNIPANGAIQGVLVPRFFTDTTSANAVLYVKFQAGAIIRTVDNRIWCRNQLATAWIEITTGAATVPTLQQVFDVEGANAQMDKNNTINLNGTRFSFQGGGSGSLYTENLSEYYHSVDDGSMPQFVYREYPNGTGGALAEWSLTGSSPVNARETGFYFQADSQTDSTTQITWHTGSIPNQSKNGQSATSIRLRPQGIRFFLRDNISKNWQIVNPTITSDTAWKMLGYNPADSSVRVLSSNGIASRNIYNSDGTLSGLRTVDFNSNKMLFNNVDTLRINGINDANRSVIGIDSGGYIYRGEGVLNNFFNITAANNNILKLETSGTGSVQFFPTPGGANVRVLNNSLPGVDLTFVSSGATELGRLRLNQTSNDFAIDATGTGTTLSVHNPYLKDISVSSSSSDSLLGKTSAGEVRSIGIGSGLSLSSGGVLSASGGSGMAIGGTITSGTATRMLFVGTNGLLQQRNLFSFDSTNLKLGIGTNSPTWALQADNTDGGAYSGFDRSGAFTGTNASIFLGSTNLQNGMQAGYVAAANEVRFIGVTASTPVQLVTINGTTGNVSIGNDIVLARSGTSIFNAGNVAIGATSATDKLEVTGSIAMMAAGNKLKIATGSNASIGTATLSSGTITVNTTAVSANSIIIVIYNTPSGTLASGLSAPSGSIVAGTSFVINSVTTAGAVNTLDNSLVNWWIVN